MNPFALIGIMSTAYSLVSQNVQAFQNNHQTTTNIARQVMKHAPNRIRSISAKAGHKLMRHPEQIVFLRYVKKSNGVRVLIFRPDAWQLFTTTYGIGIAVVFCIGFIFLTRKIAKRATLALADAKYSTETILSQHKEEKRKLNELEYNRLSNELSRTNNTNKKPNKR